ncbi:MAG TPA: hypothetical protein VJK27_09610 [Terriglobales bacterium]|jgi:hypothetical protein|nr:hypothetical protein [Terriglobales bacterium]
MKNERHFDSPLFALAVAGLATLMLIACQQTQQVSVPATAEPKPPAGKDVYVVFEGPWAFAADPKDVNSVIALAPKTKSHRELFAQTWDKTLAPGIYELSLPPRTGTAAGTIDSNILVTKIDPQSAQRALDRKSERYAIRVPKPDAYLEATHYRSRVDAKYPPDPSSEKDYVTSISLRYSVATLTGFSLAGTPDSGNFNPLLLSVVTPVIHFGIAPLHDPDPADKCHTHAREAFRDLTRLINVSLYVDFPNDPDGCHSKDPQNVHPVAAVLPRVSSFLARHSSGVLKQHLLAVIYFFGSYQNCEGPGIVGGG